MNMRVLTSSIFVVALALGATGSAYAVSDPGIPDTLRIDSATAFVSGIGVVPINFFNDEQLSQIEVTLGNPSSQIQIDSFLFDGGRLSEAVFNKLVLFNNDSSIITLFAVSFSETETIMPGNGLLGKLYYSYSQTIQPQIMVIDSVPWMDGPRLHSTSFKSIGSEPNFKPQFVKGYLDILESPETFDSVWIDEAEVERGAAVALKVYAYNERSLAKIAVALDYGSEDLLFDSVSFAGTRSAAAPSRTAQNFTSLHKLYTVISFGEVAPLATGIGPIAVLHFTVRETALEGLIVIDGTLIEPVSDTRFTLTVNDGSISLRPLFRSGSINVLGTTGVEDITETNNLPTEYALAQNYPNPFNPTTNIEFSLPEAGQVKIEIFNILGRKVRQLINQTLPAGVHRLVFDGRSDQSKPLATGVYFYRITTENFTESKKMLMLK